MTSFLGGLRPASLVVTPAACPLTSAPAATVFDVGIARTSADDDAPTFSGSGVLTLDAPSELIARTLTIETQGTLDGAEVAYVLDHTLDDVASAAGLERVGAGLAGPGAPLGLRRGG